MGRCLVETFGRVSRHFRDRNTAKFPNSAMMAATADDARSSSGGPVFSDDANVVGVVSSTQAITYSEKPDSPVQMVIKICVSGASLRALISPPETPSPTR